MNTYSLKFVLVGDAGVGKSQLSRRFSNKEFRVDSAATVGMEFSTREIPFERCIIKAQIWDTAGQERFESMTKVYYRDAMGALLVYDATNRASFENLKTVWLKQLKDFGHDGIGLVLVGNKVDKDEAEFSSQRAVPTEEAKAWAEKEGMDFVETSALTASRVEAAFRRLVLSVARSLPDCKAHLELTGLPQGWIKVVTALPPPALASVSIDSQPPPPPPSLSSSSNGSSPTTSSNNSSTKSSTLQLGLPDEAAGGSTSTPSPAGTPRSQSQEKNSSRSNSVAGVGVLPDGATSQLFNNYWTGEIQSEPPSEPAPTQMIYACNKPRLGAIDKRGAAGGADSSNLSITSPAPPRAGRCFCALL